MNAECINQKQNAWKNAVNAVAHLCGIDDIIVHGIIWVIATENVSNVNIVMYSNWTDEAINDKTGMNIVNKSNI